MHKLRYIILYRPTVHVGTFVEDDVDSLVQEFLQMKQFEHPNVMGLIGVCLDAGPAPYIVLPFMANGNLLSYLKQRRSTLVLNKETDEEEVLVVAKIIMHDTIKVVSDLNSSKQTPLNVSANH